MDRTTCRRNEFSKDPVKEPAHLHGNKKQFCFIHACETLHFGWVIRCQRWQLQQVCYNLLKTELLAKNSVLRIFITKQDTQTTPTQYQIPLNIPHSWITGHKYQDEPSLKFIKMDSITITKKWKSTPVPWIEWWGILRNKFQVLKMKSKFCAKLLNAKKVKGNFQNTALEKCYVENLKCWILKWISTPQNKLGSKVSPSHVN